MSAGDDEAAKLAAMFGAPPTVGSDGSMSWDLGGRQPQSQPQPATVETPGKGPVTWLPPLCLPGTSPQRSPATVPLLAALLGVESLRLVLEILRIAFQR